MPIIYLMNSALVFTGYALSRKGKAIDEHL